MPPSGQVPSVFPRMPRGIGLGLLIGATALVLAHLWDRRAPQPLPDGISAAAPPTAPDLLVDLPPSRSALQLRASQASGPADASAPEPSTAIPMESPRNETQVEPRTGLTEHRLAESPMNVHASVGAQAPPAASLPATPVPAPAILLTDSLAGEVRRLAELQRQRDLAWRERVVRPIDGAPMVRVDGTHFTMGDANAAADERPEHEVEVETFWIDQFEVSVEQARRFNDAADEAGHGPIRIERDQPELPLGDVSWPEAEIFCEWVGGKLPTEAQWELAARAVDGRDWPWGSAFHAECVNADLEDGALGEPMPVDSLECGAGLGGIRHLVGNVAEWTLDSYGPYASDPLEEGGTSWHVRKVVRGGSYLTRDLQALTTHSRDSERPGTRRADLGFRCVLSHEP